VLLAVLAGALAALAVPGVARADDEEEDRGPELGLVLDLSAVAGLDAESLALGVGQGASLAALFRPHPAISLAAGGHIFALYGEGPIAWFGTRAGVRLHFGELLGIDPDLWLEANHIWGLSGSVARHGLDVGLGVAFPFFDALYAGPSVHLQYVEDPDGTPVWLLSVGLSIVGWPGRPAGDAPEGWVSPARRPRYVAPRTVRRAPRPRSFGRAWILPDFELFGVHALDDEHRDAIGFGGGASASVEFPFVTWLGVHGGVRGMALSAQSGNPAAWAGTHVGLRFHWTDVAQVEGDGWIDAHHVYGVSGGISTHGADVGAGYAFDVVSFLRVGPAVRLTVLTDPGAGPTLLLSAGVTISMRQPEPSPGNRDGDFVLDRDDACPEIQEGMVEDPNNPGCPLLDRDGDSVPDDEDLCNTEPSGEHPDPSRPGCPLPDRDGDGFPDVHDFCPDVAIDATAADPLRDGCPRGAR
jgi:hypothetical protein